MSDHGKLMERVRHLSLEDKARLVTGMTGWRTWALPQVGLREMVFSDGPVGVRGTGEVEGEVSDCLPSPTAVAACWDTALAHRVGSWFATQARAHGVDIVLAPVVNMQRTPIGGRHFECLSEDPLLTADLAEAWIEGTQSGGVAACVKHFVGNEVETDRTEYLSRIDESALREVYLAPFERAVHAGVWNVMASYNRTDAAGDDSWMVAHHHLLVDVLKGEWEYDGPVVSDWTAARETVPSAVGGLDLVMPGPAGPWSDGQLVAAVRSGLVPVEALNDKVARLLWLAQKVGALPDDWEGSVPRGGVTPTVDENLPREVAARATVVLTNRDDSLPVRNPGAVSTIALIGPNAVDTRLLGGGSASVSIARPISLVEGLTKGFPGATVTVCEGVSSRFNPPDLDIAKTRLPGGDQPGVLVEYLDSAGAPISTQIFDVWSGTFEDELPEGTDSLHLVTTVEVGQGAHWLGVGTVGRHRIMIDGRLASESDVVVGGETMIDSSFNVPPARGLTVEVDKARRVIVEAWIQCVQTQWGPRARAALSHRLPEPDEDRSIIEAAELAAEADLAIVVVGTNEETESEGWDRVDLRLPGRQDDLVNAVLDKRPDAIIVVNAGAPVTMDWLDRACTVLWFWFPGQEAGSALADVLLGETEPAGRLPWTLPDTQANCPVPAGLPDEAKVIDYTEGIHVGYRGWAKSGRVPARPFGFGLGWTSWRIDDARIDSQSEQGVDVRVRVTNTGQRTGSHIVQAYLSEPAHENSGFDRPVLWLAAHGRVVAGSGQSVETILHVSRRAFEVWRPSDSRQPGCWVLPRGSYTLALGHNALDLPLHLQVAWDEQADGWTA